MAAGNTKKAARGGARTRTPTRQANGHLRGAAKAGARDAGQTDEQVAGRAGARAAKNAETASRAARKGYEDLAALGQGNLDAVMQCNAALAQSVETIGKEVLSYTQATMQEHMAQTRALLGAKTLQELVDLQSAFARDRLEKTFSESAKLSEMTVRLADETLRPLHQRMDATVQTLLKTGAA